MLTTHNHIINIIIFLILIIYNIFSSLLIIYWNIYLIVFIIIKGGSNHKGLYILTIIIFYLLYKMIIHCLYLFIIHILCDIMFINIIIYKRLNFNIKSINHKQNH
jgi:hypothetical protein